VPALLEPMVDDEEFQWLGVVMMVVSGILVLGSGLLQMQCATGGHP
jgi:hypothetical protein